MKKNFKLVLIILLFALALYPGTCFSEGLSSSELIKNAKLYDGKLVVYSGEVIGDVMLRGQFVWVNINDGENAIGVWMASTLAEEIEFSGSYKSIGDNIEITGIFHRACPQHGGDLDIHAQALRKKEKGRAVEQRLDIDKKNSSLILLGILFLIWILTLFKRK